MARIILEIPKRTRKGIAFLINASELEIGALFDALMAARPQLRMRDLAVQVAGKVGKPEDDVLEVLSAIGGLYLLLEKKGATVDTVVEAAASAVVATGDPSLTMEEPALTRFKSRLKKGLSYPQTLGITAKAFDVVGEQARLYCSARSMTDIRPVFPVGSEESPAGYVIVHTLKIRTHVANDHEEFFVVLDADDIQEMIEVLERANRKARSLRTVLARQGMHLLEGGHD
jgi:hypothetical protein